MLKSSAFMSLIFRKSSFLPETFYAYFASCTLALTVAKRKSLFDDKAVEIEELTYIIKQNLKQQRSRREQFSQPPVATSPMMANNFKSSVLMQDESRSMGDVAIDMDSQSNPLQLQLIDEQDSYIQSRADTMQNIESTIVELGSIFQQLAHMVKEQEETIQRIDANVEDTQLNVEAAHTEILKYFQSVSSNRWLMIKIFLVLIVFFIIFVVFFA
ncbi:hypothetical protein XENOCAPTIV_012326 [Xenoophorus captivus]|uniref:t-SNARE coiled-coil homology domain-containing protein n=1 Tax=Xenoophorus captivus TaxID=1517983 RepID=A0ABV0QS85_9TELE